MSEVNQETAPKAAPAEHAFPMPWAGAAGALLLLALAFWMVLGFGWIRAVCALAAVTAALILVLIGARRVERRWQERAAHAEGVAAELRAQLEAVRSRTARIREDLQSDNEEAKRANLLILLGQFTAGFMHEFNNPLAIVAGRLEVLLEERNEDAALCSDLNQMLHETRYMADIAKTMLQALRRDHGVEVFEAALPQKAVRDSIAAVRPSIENQSVKLVVDLAEAPEVDVPDHVIDQVVRGMLSNALKALKGKEDGTIWIRLESCQRPGARVELRIEDNGPGVPEQVRPHLFEPFVSQNLGRETLGMGLGLFLAASLLDMYDGRIRYENREGGGASFALELPPTRFAEGHPRGWFAGGLSA